MKVAKFTGTNYKYRPIDELPKNLWYWDEE
ncbi:hypothetical protein LCGC14_1128330 [marine sediment metagenome]|uniref:Uncharacterized protein n=1 Tax=marine sediment metagenome TaxID=412755 RepID=A0A0F9M6M6_9ZZZZ